MTATQTTTTTTTTETNHIPDEQDLALSAANSLLGSVVQNRIRRLAKSILVSTLEFLLALLTLFVDLVQSTLSHNDRVIQESMRQCGGYPDTSEAQANCELNPSNDPLTVTCQTASDFTVTCKVEGTLYIYPLVHVSVLVIAVYTIALAYASFRRAKRLAPHMQTQPEIEQAFARTNQWPLLDGLLEVPLTVQYLGYRVPLCLWGFNCFLLVVVVLMLVFSEDSEAKSAMILGSILASVQMYRISANVSELWVRTSPSCCCCSGLGLDNTTTTAAAAAVESMGTKSKEEEDTESAS